MIPLLFSQLLMDIKEFNVHRVNCAVVNEYLIRQTEE